ncbi:hypothetical protein PV04_10644 [Phialophora macrospora]|uniref:Uncharacterized protein n=1 Tax=Phialophora macrospora TaxID=1851006 RepID=A0A0D2CBT2_9EURO|nr:hypothetical protein PV04_10644 [Phialophora macrospora]
MSSPAGSLQPRVPMAPSSSSAADDGQANLTSEFDVAPASSPGPIRGSFFDLPIELRLKVYELLFCFPESIVLSVDETGLFKHKGINPAAGSIPVDALRLNKKVYLEASPVLFKCNTFALDLPALRAGLGQTQPICKLVESLKVAWTAEPLWGYVQTTKDVANKMPALRKLELKFEDQYPLLAASLEFCSAIMPCAPLLESPELRLCACLSVNDLSGRVRTGYESHTQIGIALNRPRSTLWDIRPRPGFYVSPLTRCILPELCQIQLTGKISPALFRKIEQHMCEMGDCTWVRTGEEDDQQQADETNTGRRIHLRWGKSDNTLARLSRPEVDMLQFYPELSKSEQSKLQEFFASFQVGVMSSARVGNATGGDQAVLDTEASVPDADRQTRADKLVLDQKDGVAAAPSSPTASAYSGPTTSVPTRNLDENLHALHALPFSNYHSDLAGEFMHKNTKDVDAAWAAVFGMFAGDFSITNTDTETDRGPDAGSE